MFTAKIIKKEETEQGLKIYVDFSEGEKVFSEWIIPQDEDGLKHWVKSRLASLNSISELTVKYDIDSTIDVSEPEPVEKTQAQLDKEAWFAKYYRWTRIKYNLIDTGIIPLTNTKAQALLTEVKAGLKPEYIDEL